MKWRWISLCLGLVLPAVIRGETNAGAFHARREAAAQKVADGIVLLHANSGLKRWEEAGFHQEPNFYYFTGLLNAQGAILAIDGASKQSWLFVRPKMGRLGGICAGSTLSFPRQAQKAKPLFKLSMWRHGTASSHGWIRAGQRIPN